MQNEGGGFQRTVSEHALVFNLMGYCQSLVVAEKLYFVLADNGSATQRVDADLARFTALCVPLTYSVFLAL